MWGGRRSLDFHPGSVLVALHGIDFLPKSAAAREGAGAGASAFRPAMNSGPSPKDGRELPSAAELFKGVRPAPPPPPGGLPTVPGKPGPTLPKLSGFSPLLLRPMAAPKLPGTEPGLLPGITPVARTMPAGPAVPLPEAEPGPAAVPEPTGSAPPLPAAEMGSPVPVAATVGPEPEEVSTVLLKTSSTPALLRASATMLKLGFAVAVVLGIGYVAVQYGMPLIKEMSKPPGSPAVVDKEASTAVKVIQQTRAVVAKNDARVAQLDEVIGHDAKPKEGAAKVAAPAPEPVPKPAPPKVVVKGPPRAIVDQFLAQMVVGGVFEGAEPRAYLNGRIVKLDEIVDRPLGLRFIGIDGQQKELWFSNAEGLMFRRRY